MDATRHARLNLSAGVASVAVALVLTALKLWALAQTGSLAVGATLADSALDLLMSGGGLLAILYAALPPDEDHAFGHAAAEDLAALAQSALVTLSALIIGVAGIRRLLADTPPVIEAEGTGAAVLLVSVILTGALVLWQRRVARITGSRVVAADSLHYAGDLGPALGALLALWASAALGLSRIDAVVALLAAALMVVGALHIGRRALDALMDRAAPPATLAAIEAIARAHPGVQGFHDLKTRLSGSRLFVNIHVELDGAQSLADAHAIGASLRRAILRAFPQADVLVHQDPAGVARHPEDPRR
jgi:ferrous-iron efflux pump FieF